MRVAHAVLAGVLLLVGAGACRAPWNASSDRLVYVVAVGIPPSVRPQEIVPAPESASTSSDAMTDVTVTPPDGAPLHLRLTERRATLERVGRGDARRQELPRVPRLVTPVSPAAPTSAR